MTPAEIWIGGCAVAGLWSMAGQVMSWRALDEHWDQTIMTGSPSAIVPGRAREEPRHIRLVSKLLRHRLLGAACTVTVSTLIMAAGWGALCWIHHAWGWG